MSLPGALAHVVEPLVERAEQLLRRAPHPRQPLRVQPRGGVAEPRRGPAAAGREGDRRDAAGREVLEEIDSARADADMRRLLFLQRVDRYTKHRRPVVEAVPRERAAGRRNGLYHVVRRLRQRAAHARSEVARQCFGDDVHHHVLVTAKAEWQAFNRTVTDWERRRYWELI